MRAPDFELPDQHGTPVRLSAVRGSRAVVLVFFPFAFTGVCTGELRALQESRAALGDVELLAVSCDSMFALRVFAEQQGLDLRLLSDFWPHGAVSRAYGVFDEERGCAMRGTFVVDVAGVVRWSVTNAIPDARSLDDLLAALASVRAE